MTSFFSSKNLSISMTFKLKFCSFLSKMHPNHGNERKSDIIPQEIFKSDVKKY